MSGPTTPPYARGDVIRTPRLAGGKSGRWVVLEAWGRRRRNVDEPWCVSITDITPTGGPGRGDLTRYASELSHGGEPPEVVARYDFTTMNYEKLL